MCSRSLITATAISVILLLVERAWLRNAVKAWSTEMPEPSRVQDRLRF